MFLKGVAMRQVDSQFLAAFRAGRQKQESGTHGVRRFTSNGNLYLYDHLCAYKEGNTVVVQIPGEGLRTVTTKRVLNAIFQGFNCNARVYHDRNRFYLSTPGGRVELGMNRTESVQVFPDGSFVLLND